jgi:hypothetical protein
MACGGRDRQGAAFLKSRICWVAWRSCTSGKSGGRSLRFGLAWLRDELDALVLRARGHLARRDFDAARLRNEAIARERRALLPRVVMSYVWLQEGAALMRPSGRSWTCWRYVRTTPRRGVTRLCCGCNARAIRSSVPGGSDGSDGGS